jgi:hypothetical protein
MLNWGNPILQSWQENHKYIYVCWTNFKALGSSCTSSWSFFRFSHHQDLGRALVLGKQHPNSLQVPAPSDPRRVPHMDHHLTPLSRKMECKQDVNSTYHLYNWYECNQPCQFTRDNSFTHDRNAMTGYWFYHRHHVKKNVTNRCMNLFYHIRNQYLQEICN